VKAYCRFVALLGGSVLSVSVAGAALAADLPVKARPVVAAAPPWAGFYVGAHVGYGFGKLDYTLADPDGLFGPPGTVTNTNIGGFRGATGGVLAGYNFMLTPRTLIGVEADWSASDIEFATFFPPATIGATLTSSLRISSSYSVRGRAGFVVTPNMLVYGTAGWSSAKFESLFNFDIPGQPFVAADSRRISGVQVGGGMEVNIGGNWGGRVEYLHTFYQSTNVLSALVQPGNVGPIQTVKPSIGVGRAALIYRFNDGRPTPWTGNTAPTPWTGVYAGGMLGGAAGSARAETVVGIAGSMDLGAIAVVPTPILGANLQVAQNWVIGIESEYAPGFGAKDFELGWWLAVRGRAGYLFTPSDMLYASIGWVGTEIKNVNLFAGTDNEINIPRQRVNGLQIGGGLESAIDRNWHIRFDYLYTAANQLNNVFVAQIGTIKADPAWHTGRVGLVYLITP
jgi:outer membrane immunogenic protein